MNWKQENPYKRYIDEITDDEALVIAKLAFGTDDLDVLSIKRKCNDNNIPHVEIECNYFEVGLFEKTYGVVGIFNNLNIYIGEFNSCYCQREIFRKFDEMGFNQ